MKSTLLVILFSFIMTATMARSVGDEKNPAAASAIDPTVKENDIEKAEIVKEKKTEAIPTENMGNSIEIQETDSSYYSVNKFNILFYFIYKVNFLDKNEESTSQQPAK